MQYTQMVVLVNDMSIIMQGHIDPRGHSSTILFLDSYKIVGISNTFLDNIVHIFDY